MSKEGEKGNIVRPQFGKGRKEPAPNASSLDKVQPPFGEQDDGFRRVADVLSDVHGDNQTTTLPQQNTERPVGEIAESKEFNELIYKDYLYTKSNRPDVLSALRRCEEATSYIFDVVNYRKNDESVALRQGAIGKMSLKEMCARVSESGPLQWREKPAFFGAIVLEMDWRLTVIRQVEDVAGKK